MDRTIADIKNEMMTAYIGYDVIREKYDIKEGQTPAEIFSPLSFESVLFYVVAAGYWSILKLFDTHKVDTEEMLSNRRPLYAKWYRDKLLAFQVDYVLPVDSDIYAEINETAKVIKHAAVVEAQDSSKVLFKIAGGTERRERLSDEIAAQVYAYIQRIKGIGVRVDLINLDPDHYRCEIDVYFNAMLLPDRVKAAVYDAIVGYIESLDFNGEYTNVALTDILQKIEGVIIPEIKASYSKPATGDYAFALIEAKKIPEAGYFRAYAQEDIIINMIPYELLQS